MYLDCVILVLQVPIVQLRSPSIMIVHFWSPGIPIIIICHFVIVSILTPRTYVTQGDLIWYQISPTSAAYVLCVKNDIVTNRSNSNN